MSHRKTRYFVTLFKWHPDKIPSLCWVDNFNEWVDIIIDKESGFLTRLYEQYIGVEGSEICSYIGRIESLEDDFCEVMGLLGYEDELRNNKTRIHQLGIVRHTEHRVVRPVWNNATLDRMLYSERVLLKRFYDKNNESRKKLVRLRKERQCQDR